VESHDVLTGRVRYASYVVASLSGLHLAMFGFLGYLVVTTDWRLLDCFDGTEPGCDEPAPDAGLSAVPASGWLLVSLAVIATCAAFVLALRVRSVAHAVPVVLLSAMSVAIAQALWWLV
jgi:hypothetical protein